MTFLSSNMFGGFRSVASVRVRVGSQESETGGIVRDRVCIRIYARTHKDMRNHKREKYNIILYTCDFTIL